MQCSMQCSKVASALVGAKPLGPLVWQFRTASDACREAAAAAISLLIEGPAPAKDSRLLHTLAANGIGAVALLARMLRSRSAMAAEAAAWALTTLVGQPQAPQQLAEAGGVGALVAIVKARLARRWRFFFQHLQRLPTASAEGPRRSGGTWRRVSPRP